MQRFEHHQAQQKFLRRSVNWSVEEVEVLHPLRHELRDAQQRVMAKTGDGLLSMRRKLGGVLNSVETGNVNIRTENALRKSELASIWDRRNARTEWLVNWMPKYM
jgi:hypothetical protein